MIAATGLGVTTNGVFKLLCHIFDAGFTTAAAAPVWPRNLIGVFDPAHAIQVFGIQPVTFVVAAVVFITVLIKSITAARISMQFRDIFLQSFLTILAFQAFGIPLRFVYVVGYPFF